MRTTIVTAAGIMVLLGAGGAAFAQPTPTMYTIDQIYYYLVEGTEADWGVHSMEPQSGVPGGEVPGYGKSLGDIYNDIKALFNQADATTADVSTGKIFFSTQTDHWGIQTGTAYQTLLKTGQITSYNAGDDGYYEKGTAFNYQTADPVGNGDIIVIDNVTGLMWAQDGNGEGCGSQFLRRFNDAINWAEGLTFAGYNDWRMPNVRELLSLIVMDKNLYDSTQPLINEPPFVNTKRSGYWSSTTLPGNTSFGFRVDFRDGDVIESDKITVSYQRAVRGGE